MPVSTRIVTIQLLPRVSLVTVAMSMRALNRKVAQCSLSRPLGLLGAGHGNVGIGLWVGVDWFGDWFVSLRVTGATLTSGT
jgi:hypothetical protein